MVPEYPLTPLVAQHAEMCDDVFLGIRNLDCLDRGKHITERARHARGGLAAALPITFEARIPRLHRDEYTRKRQTDEKRDLRVDAEQKSKCTKREQRLSNGVNRPVHCILALSCIIAKASDRFTDRFWQRTRSRTIQYALQHVPLQERSHRETKAAVD